MVPCDISPHPFLILRENIFHAMEKLSAIWLRATLGPCPEAGLACGNPFAKRALSTQWGEFVYSVKTSVLGLFSVVFGLFSGAVERSTAPCEP